MIFYFSGTGNSLQAAKIIAACSGERLVSIADCVNGSNEVFEYTLSDNEIIGFVYPVYAWAPPKMVFELIDRLKLENYKSNYVFSVATCGDEIGNAMKVLGACLKRKNIELNSGFSVQMPNNYIISYDVDSKELEKQKLESAEATLKRINRLISERKRGVFEVVKGYIPAVMTGVVNPIFKRHAVNPDRFYASDDCTGCGICEKVCNCKNISVDGKPQWGKNCSQCLACVHYCPAAAVQYGKRTCKKGRYRNPNIKTIEMYRS